MTEEFEEHVFSEMDDIRGDNRVAVPDVGHIHRRVASQQRRAGFAVAALVIAGVAGFWATRPTTTDLATGDEAIVTDSLQAQGSDDTGAVADASAPTVVSADSPNQIQRRLEATPRWFVASLTGSPDKPPNEIVVFADDRLILDNCDANLFDLEWKQDGFSVVGPSPIDLTAEVPTPGCSRPAGSQLAASMPAGLSVTVEANANGTISLNSNEWEVTLTANPTASETLIYVSLLLDDASARAEERGLKWRIANLDGEPLRLTHDLVPGRLNFTVEDGIVIHVRTDDQLGTPDAPQVTTTTILEPADQYLWLTVEEAGTLAEANGRVWRVVRKDGQDLGVRRDRLPGRLNFTIEDNVVTGVEVETNSPEPVPDRQSPSGTLRLVDTWYVSAMSGRNLVSTVEFDAETMTMRNECSSRTVEIRWDIEGGGFTIGPDISSFEDPLDDGVLCIPVGIDVSQGQTVTAGFASDGPGLVVLVHDGPQGWTIWLTQTEPEITPLDR